MNIQLTFLALLFSMQLFINQSVTAQQVQICTWKNNALGCYNIIHDDFGDNGVIGIQNYADTMHVNRGLTFTFGAITSSCESNPGMYAKANTLISHKHEIISHSHTHSCAIGSGNCGGTGVNYQWAVPGATERLNIEVDQAHQSIITNTGMTPRFFIYPYDQFNTNSESHLQNNGYIGSRTGTYNASGPNNTAPNAAGYFQTPFVVDVANGPNGVIADRLNYWVDYAIANNQWVNRELHNVGTTGWGHVEVADYRDHLNYLKQKKDAGELWVGTISEILTYQIQKLNYTPTSSYNNSNQIITVNWNTPTFNVQNYLQPLQVKSPITLSVDLTAHPGLYTVMQNSTILTDWFIKNNIMYINVYPHQGSVILSPAACPSICFTSHPSNQIVNEGVSATFTVGATSAETLSYQWYLGATPISGATSASYTVNNATTANAGNYTVKITTTNYTATSNIATLTVNSQTPFAGIIPIPGTIQMENFDNGGQSISYNESTATNQGDAPGYRSGPVDIENNGTGGYNIGYITNGEWLEYSVNVANTGTYNFIFTFASQDYGQTNGNIKVSMDGIDVIASQNVNFTGGWATWATQTVNNISLTAGNHILRFTATVGDFNIDKIVVNANGSVTPTITFNAINKTYGDASFNANATSTSTGAITYSITAGNTFASITPAGVVTILGAGTVTIQATQAAVSGFTSATKTTTLTIAKKMLTVTADDKSKNFNTANPALTLQYTGFAYSDNSTSLTTQASATTTALTNSPVGPYPITPSGAASNNYTFNYINGTLTVNGIAPSITFSTINKTYGDASFTASATSNSAGALTYSIITGNTFASITSAGVVTILGAGSVTIQVSQVANGNFLTATQTATLTLAKKALTVTADDKSKNFNTANPALILQYSGFAYSDNAASLITQASATTTALTNSPVGPYPITPSGAASNNYTFNYVNGTLTVNGIAPSITFSAISKTYGDASFTASATSNSAGALTYSIITGNTFASITSTGVVTILGAGSVTIQVSQVANGNFLTATQTATLTLAKKALTVTADDKSKNFNTANPALTLQYSGFAYSDNAASLITQASATTTAILTSPVGPYPITPSGAASNNYTFNYINGTLTVNSTPNSNPIITLASESKVYGDPLFTVTATSNSTGAFSYSVISGSEFINVATNGQIVILGVGTATIQVNQAAASGFNPGSQTATITITKKILTVTTLNYTRLINTNNPIFTISYSEFAYNENENNLITTASATCTADINSIEGNYPIALSGASSNNYDFLYINSILTIESDINTSTQEATTSQINLFPNPCKERTTLSIPSSMIGQSVRVFNQQGQSVAKKRLTIHTNEIILDQLNAGIYFVLFENGTTMKLIKE